MGHGLVESTMSYARAFVFLVVTVFLVGCGTAHVAWLDALLPAITRSTLRSHDPRNNQACDSLRICDVDVVSDRNS